MSDAVAELMGIPDRVELRELISRTLKTVAHGLSRNTHFHHCLIEEFIGLDDAGIVGQLVVFVKGVFDLEEISLIGLLSKKMVELLIG